MDINNIWNLFLEKVKDFLDPILYETWFMDTKLIELSENCAKVLVPMQVHKKHLKENYNDLVEEIFTEITGTNFNFEYVIEDEIKNNVVIDTDNVGVPSMSSFESNLDPRYTFDNFIVGQSNKFAKATSLAVAERPGFMYNPLFIYGKSGLGKTHLMHAIGNYIESKFNKIVLYVTSDDFMNDFTGLARKNNNVNNLDYVTFFKNKYRNVDVLLIDDIQFLGGAEKTQQEFFHTFNNLYNDSKQIIVSSDRSPEDLKVLEDRLRTRFAWGLQVDISPPDYDLKVAIIKKKLKREAITINDEVIAFIASNIGNDVRQLEGSITRLVAYSAIMCVTDITLDFAMEALKDFTKKETVTDQNNIRRIQKSVANFYKISFEDMKSKKRTPNLAIPRQVAMYLCRKLTDESFERIGIEFSGKNHATVIHACNKIEREMKVNKDLSEAIYNIEKQLT